MRDGARAQGRVDPPAVTGDGATRRTVGEGQRSVLVWLTWLVMGDRRQHEARVDAADGSEFVDDRLRLRE